MKTRTGRDEAEVIVVDAEATNGEAKGNASETETAVKAAPTVSSKYRPSKSSELWILSGFANDIAPYEIDLPHPRTGRLSRFALAVSRAERKATLGEIRVFGTRQTKPASFLTVVGKRKDVSVDDKKEERVEGAQMKGKIEEEKKQEKKKSASRDENEAIISEQEMHVVTEIDPVFLLLPVVAPQASSASTSSSGPSSHHGRHSAPKSVFLPFDDLMDSWKEQSSHVGILVDEGYTFNSPSSSDVISTSVAASIHKALERCCDSVTAADETMYRFSEDKFFRLILEKARRMVDAGLPPSLDEMATRAVATTLVAEAEAEAEADAKADADAEVEAHIDRSGTPGPGEVGDSDESQASSNLGSVFSQTLDIGDEATKSTSKTTTNNIDLSSSSSSSSSTHSKILTLMRLRIAIDFLLTNYVPPSLSKRILSRLDQPSSSTSTPTHTQPPNFTTLRAHLAQVKAQRSSALQAQTSTFSRKRTFANEDELAEEQAEKRRKKEEEDLKRKNESAGVKALRKVNTSGMMKLSAFFTAKPKTTK